MNEQEAERIRRSLMGASRYAEIARRQKVEASWSSMRQVVTRWSLMFFLLGLMASFFLMGHRFPQAIFDGIAASVLGGLVGGLLGIRPDRAAHD